MSGKLSQAYLFREMTLKEIVHKEDITGSKINFYREGLFWRAYEQSAYRFVFGITFYKPSKKTIKAIDTEVISIRVPVASLEKFATLFDILSQDDKQMVIEPKQLVATLTFEQWKEKISLSKLKPKVGKVQSIEKLQVEEEMLKFNAEVQTPDEQLASYCIVCDLSRARAYREKGDMEKAHFYLEKARVSIEGLHKISHVLYLQELALYKKQQGSYQKALELTDLLNSKHQSQNTPIECTNVAELTDDEILYRNLCALMESDMVFTSQIGRKELADMLQTNTTYIVAVIKRFSDGMTVTAFINGYRLRYAGMLLSERNDLSVDAIGEEAGFTSRSTYYRQFRDYYGMSPNEYRSLSRKSNQ